MVDTKKTIDQEMGELKKAGYEVKYLGFSFGKGNSIEVSYLVRREGKASIVSKEHKF